MARGKGVFCVSLSLHEDVFFVMDKGTEKQELVRLRKTPLPSISWDQMGHMAG